MDKILDLRTHLPQYYKDVREIDIIAKAVMYVLSNLRTEILQILANNFVQTANEYGVERLERILDITPDPTLDLESRRQRVLSKMATSTIFTLRVLQTNLQEMCDNGEYTLDMNYDTFYMDLKVRVGKKGMLDVLYDLLYTMLPAHVGFYLHNHLPAVSQGGTFFAAAARLKHVYKVVDGVTPKGSTSLTLVPGATTSFREETAALDAIVEVLNSSLDVLPGAATATLSHKQLTDGQKQKLSTEQTLQPGLAVASAHVVIKK